MGFSLSWDVPTIAWLDYDGRLTEGVLTDTKTFFSRATPGSVYLASVNAHPAKGGEGPTDNRLNELIATVGEGKIPPGVTGKELRDWGTAAVYRRIIQNEIDEVLTDRNGGRAIGSKLLYRQLFNFHYADGAKMLTVGGILYDEGLVGKVESCNFRQLKYVKTDSEPFLIEPPNLTYREMRFLDTQLPKIATSSHPPGVPPNDIERYGDLYRYFPNFAETEL